MHTGIGLQHKLIWRQASCSRGSAVGLLALQKVTQEPLRCGELREVCKMPKADWQRFIANAEMAWFRVFDSGATTRLASSDGAPLFCLPAALASRRQIYQYFRRWWGPRLAQNMLCSLPLLERSGHLYVIGYDFPPISMTAGPVGRESAEDGQLRLHTLLTGGFEDVPVRYRLQLSPFNRRYMIVSRWTADLDFRYQDHRRAEE